PSPPAPPAHAQGITAHDRSRTGGGSHSAQLRGAVRKRLLRPTGIAWITSVVAWVAITATTIDKQGALYPGSGEIALEGPRIVSQVVAVKAWVTEHDDGAG